MVGPGAAVGGTGALVAGDALSTGGAASGAAVGSGRRAGSGRISCGRPGRRGLLCGEHGLRRPGGVARMVS